MNTLIYIFGSLILSSCYSNDSNQEKTINDSISTTVKMDSADTLSENESIEVRYWNSYEARLHILEYAKGELKLYCDDEELKSKISDINQVNQFVSLVKRFYIEKSEDIILIKEKLEYITSSNYSYIEIKVKNLKGEIQIDERTQIGSEKYDVEYNPEFIKLYALIQELTNPCNR